MPDTIVTNYETGAIPEIRIIFHASAHFGCWFRFSQCIYRTIQEFGPSCDYKTDKKFQDVARKLFSLAYLPINEISMALAFYQEKINSCEKVGKIFDCLDFLDFGSNSNGFIERV